MLEFQNRAMLSVCVSEQVSIFRTENKDTIKMNLLFMQGRTRNQKTPKVNPWPSEAQTMLLNDTQNCVMLRDWACNNNF